MNKEEFVSKVGWVFEHSPWVPLSPMSWDCLPFKSREELLQTMMAVMKEDLAIGPASMPIQISEQD